MVERTAVDIVMARLCAEEGEKLLPYDDATGMVVKAPHGKITWGRGFNLEACGSAGLFDVMERYLVTQLEAELKPYRWYQSLDAQRASVCLDIAYNGGVNGLLHYPHMLAALAVQDWPAAAAQCTSDNPALKARYDNLSKLLLRGEP